MLERRLADVEAELAQARLSAQHALEDYEGKMNSALAFFASSHRYSHSDAAIPRALRHRLTDTRVE